VLVRLDPAVAGGWSDEDVVRRWGRLFPPRDQARQPLPVSKQDLTPIPATNREPIRASGGDSLRR